jgi:hypothetical protein
LISGEEQYFLIAFWDYLQTEINPQVEWLSRKEFKGFCEGYALPGDMPEGLVNANGIIDRTLNQLVLIGVLERLSDEFAGDHYFVSEGASERTGNFVNAECPKFSSYLRFGTNGHEWLGAAIAGIEKQKPPYGTAPAEDRDLWVPLTLNRERPVFTEILAELELAITAVGADNGFAVTYPGERDNLLRHARATQEAVVSGNVTRSQIRHNIIEAGKWLMDKFAGTAIGTIGAELVKIGMRIMHLIQ